MRTRRSSQTAAAALVAAAAISACSELAGIEEFHFVAPTEASVADGPISPVDGSANDASDVVDAGTPVDDAAACGGCDGGCVLGQCSPLAVATGLDDPQSIAVVGNLVVWAEYSNGNDTTGAVKACPALGACASPITLHSNSTRPILRQAGTGGALAYWQLNVTSRPSTPLYEVLANATLTKITDVPTVFAAAASPTYAVWIGDKTMNCTRSACAQTTAGVPYAGMGFPTMVHPAMALAGDRAAWTPANNGVFSTRVPSGTEPVSWRNGSEDVADIGIDGTDLYFIATARNQLEVQPLKSGTPATDIANVGTATALTFDDRTIYVAGRNGVFAVDKATHVRTPVTQAPARGVACSANFVFWTEAGRVMMAPK